MKKIKPKNSFPTKVEWAITGRCNLRCAHCNAADTWNANEFTTRECKDFLSHLNREGLFNLFIFGGEPFIRPDFIEILEHLNSIPLAWTMSTNATLIDDEHIRVLKQMRFLKGIQVSVDGSCPEVHDRQRGEGTFDTMLRGLRKLISAGIKVNVRMSLTRLNMHDIEGMIKFVKKEGIGNLGIGDVVKSGAACENDMKIGLAPQEYRRVFVELDVLRKKYPEVGFSASIVQILDMIKDFYSRGPGQGRRGTFGACGAGQSTIGVRSDGEVVPCSGWWSLPLGNIRKTSLREIWNKSEKLNEIRALKDIPLANYEECRTCDYISYCNGGCRASAYYSTGEMDGRHWLNCEIYNRNPRIEEIVC
ncbi:MAG: radical SAM protein [Candidatus Margulisiibacteriota bacterium]